MMPQESQVDRALEAILPALPASPGDEQAPQTPFPTSLVLSRDQEDALVDHVLLRCSDLERDMGRVVLPRNQVPAPDPSTFMGRRELWTLRYYNHVEDRAQPNTIYQHSNLTASLSQRITMQMVARANNFFFATQPFFTCKPVNHDGDTDFEDKLDQHLHWKFAQSKLTRTLESANEYAFVRGEAVLKTTYVKTQQRYKKRGMALVDEQGNPVTDSDGNPIMAGAAWQPVVAPPEVEGAEPIVTGYVLKSDGVTPKPEVEQYAEGLWNFHVTTKEGAQCDLVYFKDFLWPLDAPTLHEADINIHLYSLPVMSLVEMFMRSDLAAAGARDLETMRRAVDMIRNMNGSASDVDSGAKAPRMDHGEQNNTTPSNSPDAEIIEAWVRFDVDGDGIQEEVMVVIDRKNRFPVFYDYTANLTESGRRPFEMVRARAVDGRAYGIGAMEYFEPEQEFIDLTINRRNFRMSKAGRVTFWAPHMTLEGRANPKLTLNYGNTYTLAEGYKPEECLAHVELPDDSQNLMEMLNFFMQLMQLKSGVINAGDQEASGLPSSNTATGINDVAKSGQEMFAQYLSALKVGIEDVLMANVLCTYRNLNAPEVFRFFQGNTAGIDTITPEEVKNLKFAIHILLTRQQAEKVLQTSAQASAMVKDFYAQPPVIQTFVAPFYQEGVMALGYNNARQVIQVAPISSAAPGDPNAQGAIGAGQAAGNSGAPAAPEAEAAAQAKAPEPVI